MGREWGRGPRPCRDPTRSKAARSLRSPESADRPGATLSGTRGSVVAASLAGGVREVDGARTSVGRRWCGAGECWGPRFGWKDRHGGALTAFKRDLESQGTPVSLASVGFCFRVWEVIK